MFDGAKVETNLDKLIAFLENLDARRFRIETIQSLNFEADKCDTAACVAGWTLFLFHEHPRIGDEFWAKNSWCEEAGKLLGMNEYIAHEAFVPPGWGSYPKQFTLGRAIRMLKRYRLTGEVVW